MKTRKPALLAGGNPRIAKGDGDAPVQAYIRAMLIARSVPKVRKAVPWNSPFYGIDGRGWFLVFGGTGKEARWIDIHEDDLDEKRLSS